MKVRVTLELTVDPVLWAQEYGLGSLAEVPADVESYVTTWASAQTWPAMTQAAPPVVTL